MINIPSTNDDPAYRYKMPRLASKKEGRGNGSKTCIVNMGEVARALKRPPQYTTKWFGNELGAMSTYTNLASQGERCIINGHHETSVFQESLDNFIAKYVCCQNCKLPEIDMKVKKGMIVGQCLACGWQGNLDNNHKLAVFIAKNPPDASGNNIVVPGEEKGKLDKKARRAEKLARSKAAGEEEGGGEDDASSNESKEDKKDKKKKKDKKVKGSDDEDDSEEKEKKKKKKKDKKDKKADDSDNEDEGKDKKKKKKKDKKAKDSDSEEDAKEKKKKKKKQKEEQNSDSEDDAKEKKKKKKQKEERDADSDDEEKDKKKKKKDKKEKKEKREKSESESEHSSVEEKAKGNGKEDDDEVRDLEYDDPELQSVIEVLKEFAESKGGKPKADDFFEEVRMHQLAKCFDNKVKLYVVFEALCGSTMDAKSMGSQKKYINKIISSASMTTTEVLWTINVYYKVNTGVIKSYPMALKCAYDEEWLQEDELRAYFEENKGAGEPGFENCKKYAAPFLKWLATAGSDDSSSEEESD